MDEDIRALKRLIKFYTNQRDWFMVERLSNDLGNLFKLQEYEEPENPFD